MHIDYYTANMYFIICVYYIYFKNLSYSYSSYVYIFYIYKDLKIYYFIIHS